ncbi:type IV pilin protein [Methylococcus sp. EFPC2]|uniref:type IV pilin protein n=1 Tax=Methylococcus sp. EFPC2 TaxID=2812648 RepID=UPI0027399250|nr:type IV pilin protein [Methylococcus sp. EFPC2]
MITVAVVAILASVAYPSYQQHIRKTRRADAKVALMRAANAQERWFTENNTYSSSAANLGWKASGGAYESDEGYYTMTVSNPSCTTGTFVSCYTLTATAKGVQAGDTKCASLSLNHLAQKTSTGGGADCW